MAKKSTSAKAFRSRVEHMLENRVEASVVKLSEDERLFPYYDECLKLVMHGEPISDSRPRHLKDRDGTYNPHKAYLMRVFGKLYEQDTLLQKTMIQTPFAIDIRNYVTPTKRIQKLIGPDIIEEQHVSIKQKDNDNIEKVHWDVLQDIKYKILLDDKLVTHNRSSQFYSVDPRIEIDIHYPSKEMLKSKRKYFAPYIEEIEHSSEFKKYKIHPKYLFNDLKVKDKDFPKIFFNNLAESGLTVSQTMMCLNTLYNANQILQLATYCKIKPTTRVANTVALEEIIRKETYPVVRKARRLE